VASVVKSWFTALRRELVRSDWEGKGAVDIFRTDACAGSVNAYRKIDLTTDLKLTRYPRSLAATLTVFPSVSLFPQLGSQIIRIPEVDSDLIPNVRTTADTFVIHYWSFF
jgi:hypothetical protein